MQRGGHHRLAHPILKTTSCRRAGPRNEKAHGAMPLGVEGLEGLEHPNCGLARPCNDRRIVQGRLGVGSSAAFKRVGAHGHVYGALVTSCLSKASAVLRSKTIVARRRSASVWPSTATGAIWMRSGVRKVTRI